MSVGQLRGGIPEVFRSVITAGGRKHDFPFFTNYVIIRTDADVRVYFTEQDYNDDANYVEILAPAAGIATSGWWEGPAELEAIWLKGVSNVEVVAFQRRG